MSFTDADLAALKNHLVTKVEHGWTVYKLEGLIDRLGAAERFMSNIEGFKPEGCTYFCCPLHGPHFREDLADWKKAAGK